jgi:hypothetical protein
MKTRADYDKQLRNQYLDSNSQNRERTVRVVFHQIRESAMVKIRTLSSAGQKRNPAFGLPAYEPCLKLTDWPVY